MKITADTNVLVRGAVFDDPRQALLAAEILRESELVAIPVSVLCEFAWVLRQGYKRKPAEIARSIRSLISGAQVVTDRPAVEAGLKLLEAGGDFADGVIAYEGEWLGATEFVSFDKTAVNLLRTQGRRAKLLG